VILVVDDEPIIRALVVDVVEDLGYAAMEAGDGQRGLEAINSHAQVQLLITDIGLPSGMNGRQLADAARATRPGLKVLFITGNAFSGAIAGQALEEGMHVLAKPFDLGVLADKVREILDA